MNELFVIALFAVAALLHGISGSGFSLIAIGGLSNYYPLSEAIIFVLLPTAVLNTIAWLVGEGRFGLTSAFTCANTDYLLLFLCSAVCSEPIYYFG